jgi:hypothetical protein
MQMRRPLANSGSHPKAQMKIAGIWTQERATGIIFDPQGVEFPVIPERPSKEEARQALNIPIDIIKDFPFDGVRRPKGQDQAHSNLAAGPKIGVHFIICDQK